MLIDIGHLPEAQLTGCSAHETSLPQAAHDLIALLGCAVPSTVAVTHGVRRGSPGRTMSHWHETYRMPATITLSGGASIEGDIHLQTLTAVHEGRETPVEMLNRDERFFAVSLPSGDATLVCKAQVAVVTSDAALSEIDPQRLAISRKFALDIHMIGGQRLSGSAHWELSPTRPRPQDFLNVPENFFEITDGSNTHCVNRALVGQVNPAE